MNKYWYIIIIQGPYLIWSSLVLPNALFLFQDPIQDTTLHLVIMALLCIEYVYTYIYLHAQTYMYMYVYIHKWNWKDTCKY